MDIRFTNKNIFEIDSESIVFFTDHSLLGEKTNLLIQKAGEGIIEPLIKQAGCATGEVKIVPAFHLESNYVLLSVLPDKDHPLAEKLFEDMLFQIFNTLRAYNIHSAAFDLSYVQKLFDQGYVALLNEVVTRNRREYADILLYLCKGDFVDNRP
ncbi:MAG: hypothetical protein Q4G11_01605 [Gallicola sp.]|nr:hypothetical protein [Gallicola sp.]